MFGKIKIIKALARFELMTYRLVDNALFHCAMLLGNILLGKKIVIKLYLMLLYFNKMYVTIWSVSYNTCILAFTCN